MESVKGDAMIQTNRLMLKKMTDEDTVMGIRILLDDTVKKTYMLPDLTDQTAKKLFERLMELSYSEAHYVRGIYLDHSLIGFLNDTEIKDGAMELGWVIHPDYHNHGYATEAVASAIEDLLSKGYIEVTAGAFSENRASIRVMEKCGMQLLDKTEEIEYRGLRHNCVFYAIKKVRE